MSKRLDPMVFAMVFAFVAPLGLGGAAAWMALSETNVGTVQQWQTLIAGLIAIAAALIGGGFVYNQTAEARRQERARIARHHAAARAVLPLALSGLVEYAEEVATALESLRSTAVGHRVGGSAGLHFDPPQLRPGLIEPLRDVIASASDPVAARVARIIADVQIMDSRLRSAAKSLRPGSSSLFLTLNLDDYIVSAATIFARCEGLFHYARLETDDPPRPFPTAQNLWTALNLMGFDEWLHSDMYDMARARALRYAEEEPAG